MSFLPVKMDKRASWVSKISICKTVSNISDVGVGVDMGVGVSESWGGSECGEEGSRGG